MKELKRGLLMASLLGLAPKDIKYPLRSYVKQPDSPVLGAMGKPWTTASLVLRIGDGPEQEFPLHKVPMDLWPDDMRHAYSMWQRREARRKELAALRDY